MRDFGIVKPGTTLYIPFATYDSNDPTASVTITGFAVTDIEIYKDGGTTQRASDNGYALLDTDGTDFDGLTGIHGFSIDLADNTTAGFYAAGSQYWVVVSSITVDAGVVSFIAATFRIGMPDAILNTTIATLASQTSFTLTAGPAEDNALVGCAVYIHDVASAVQGGFAVISAYTGSTKTVTLTAGTTYTAAATDNISVLSPVNTKWFGATAVTGRDLGASVLLSSGTGTGQLDFTSGVVKSNLVQILATALTETAGQIAAAFKKFFDKATPTGTINSLPDAVAGTTGGVFIAGTNAATTVTTALTTTFTGNLTGSVGSVTGAVGSVTGNVGGSVASVATNGITATSIATDAINAAAVKADAVTKIQAGLATPTNITAGTITTVTNLTNAPTAGDLTATMKASVNAEVVDVLRTDTIPDSYSAHEALPTIAQAILAIHQFLMEREVSGTSVTVQKPDGTTTAMTLTLNSATDPTTVHRSA